MMSESRHHAIPVAPAVVEALRSLEEGSPRRRTDPASGAILYALARATRAQRLLLVAEDPLYLALWMAAGARAESDLTIITGADSDLVRAAFERAIPRALPAFLPPGELEHLAGDDDLLDMVVLDLEATIDPSVWESLRAVVAPQGLFAAAGAIQQGERVDALRQELSGDSGWRALTVEKGEGLLLAARAGRPVLYEEAAHERFMGLLLQVMQPERIVLGPNVVFDGAIKPLRSRVDFSGVGGEIGAGDLLIAHPDDLQRFTPLTGATALLLGELSSPIHTANVILPLGDAVVTLVVA